MKNREPLLSTFYSQHAVSARVCLRVRKSYSVTHCTAAITENRSLPILTFTHLPFYRYQSAILCAAPALYNPHSRYCAAAQRFSPTRFILPSLLPRLFQNLIASSLWG
jgi:hypothetical protein